MDGPRPLTATEAAALHALLTVDFPGVDALRAQAATVLARTGCACGCGTIDLLVPEPQPAVPMPSPVPAELTIVDDSGTPLGSVRLFTEAGALSSLRVSAYTDPLPMPDLRHTLLEPFAIPGN